ncbi:Uncharacterised protein [uncultured Blautia sp.]|nr:hypothetical protein [Hoministercoradaptatus ammoniilyticus]SCI35670.1 Uncharacterised protein [uncultured Blautia sp.]
MPEYTLDMKGYASKYGFYISENLSRREAERTLQLEPEPPKESDLNNYIIQAQQQKDLRYLSFFLHHYEKMLNGRIYSFWRSDGNERYDPERFLDYKMTCVVAVIERFSDYDPSTGADFTTYLYPFITDALLSCRMLEESWSVDSLDQYKKIRGIAWKYRTSGENTKKTISEYAVEKNCKQETAAEYLNAAKGIRSRQSFYVSRQDEDSEETGEDVSRDDYWDYAEILWNGIKAEAIQKAFDALDYREQTLLEKRNAICMRCGRVSPMSSRSSFEELATLFEGSGTSGAERAYRKALDKLTTILVEEGILHAVRLKRKNITRKKKEIATAIHLYQVDYDGEWGEIYFDFVNRTTEIRKLAEWDRMISKVFSKKAICYIQTHPLLVNLNEIVISFSLYEKSRILH